MIIPKIVMFMNMSSITTSLMHILGSYPKIIERYNWWKLVNSTDDWQATQTNQTLCRYLIPPKKKSGCCVCVYVHSTVSICLCLSVWLSTRNSTTQHTNIVQAQLNHCSPPLSQEFPPILAQRILLTLAKYEPSGSIKPQKHKTKQNLYIFLIT